MPLVFSENGGSLLDNDKETMLRLERLKKARLKRKQLQKQERPQSMTFISNQHLRPDITKSIDFKKSVRDIAPKILLKNGEISYDSTESY